MKQSTKLGQTYYNPKSVGSFGGVNRLKASHPEVRVTDIKKFLEAQKVYQLHKFTRKKFPRRKTSAPFRNYLWQADLIQMDRYARYNKGFKYILTAIDVNSRYGYAQCVKNKTGKDVTEAFERIVSDKNKPKKLQVDRGKEFYNKTFKSFLIKSGIELFSNFSEFKAAVVERFNGTLLTRIAKHFTVTNTKRYFDVLEDIVSSYNQCVHRITRLKPCDVDKTNEMTAWYNSNKQTLRLKTKAPKFKQGDAVRVIKMKNIFEKGYAQRFTDDVYFIANVITGHPTVYKIKDSGNEVMNGIFYEAELVHVKTDESLVDQQQLDL